LVAAYESKATKIPPPNFDGWNLKPGSVIFVKLRLVGGNWILEIQAWPRRKWD
jgi:hypothetical protein